MLWIAALAAGLAAGSFTPASVAAAPPDSSAVPTALDIARLGYDNVTVDSTGTRIAYENRRFRHSAYARGILDRRLTEFPAPAGNGARTYYERRYGMMAAMIETRGAPGDTGARTPDRTVQVRYPSDASFVPPPPGRPRGDTRFATDFELNLRFAYQLGGIHDPFVTRFELEPRMRVNPWDPLESTCRHASLSIL